MINEHNDDNKYKNSSALKVAVEDYIMDHHPGAEVDPFNYEIKTSKVEILQLANQN